MTASALARKRKEVVWMEVRYLWLNAHMIEKEWSNSALALAVSTDREKPLSRQYISQLRTGTRKTCSTDMATRIAAVMGVPLSDLFIPRTTSTKRTGPVLAPEPLRRAS